MSPDLLRNKKFLLFLIILLSLFLYLWRIGDIVFVDEDEAIYAQCASEILHRGDWITLYYNFEPFIDKQPLVPWLNALSFIIFGKGEFAVRFWHSLMAVISVYILYLIVALLFEQDTALISSAIFATFTFYFYQARSPLMDIPLNMFILLSFYSLIAFLKTKRIFYIFLYWLSLGLAVMTKGIVGFVLPVIITSLFLFINRRKNVFHDIKKYFIPLLAGFILFIIVAGTWHLLEYNIYGYEFINRVFLEKTFGRYLKGDGPTVPAHSFFIHFITILLGCLPWSGFIPCGIILLLRDRDNSGRKYFLFIWLIAVFLFFSISAPKRIRYILPLFPVMAVITGNLWALYFKSNEKYVKKFMTLSAIFSIPVCFIIFGAILYARLNFPIEYSRFAFFCLPPLILLAGGIVISSVILLFHRKKAAFIGFLLVSIFMFTSLIWLSPVYFNKNRPMKVFALIINEKEEEEYLLASFQGLCPSLAFYTDHKVEYLSDREELKEYLNTDHRAFLMAEEKDLNLKEFQRFCRKELYVLKEQAGYLLITNRKD